MTQVFFTKSSTSPWAVPSSLTVGQMAAWNYGGTTNFWSVGGATTSQQVLQQFSVVASGPLDSVTVSMYRTGAPADNVFCALFDVTGTTRLATATPIAGPKIYTNGQGGGQTFFFPTPYTVTAGQTYSLIFYRSGAVDTTNYCAVTGIVTAAYGAGLDLYQYNGTSFVKVTTASLQFNATSQNHSVQLVGAGGNGAAGTIGSPGNGGGGGSGGNWGLWQYAGSGLIPGTTTIPFLIPAGGAGNAAFTCWQGSTHANCNSSTCGGNASGITGGAAAGGNGIGTPALAYHNGWGWLGGSGATTASGLGGGGGAGVAGPGAAANQIVIPAAATGGGGGGAGGWIYTGSASSGTSAGQGGTGLTGTPGTSSGQAGTGSCGGCGSNATTTTGSTGGAGGGTDTYFDLADGFGGGGGGAGAATGAGTYTITGGNGGSFGSGGGGCGYGNGTATFVAGVGGDGLAVVYYVPAHPPLSTGVQLDTIGALQSAGSTSVTTFSYTGITVGTQANRALLVFLYQGSGSNPSAQVVTWDSGGTNQAMTNIGVATATGVRCRLYALLNPTPGNKTLAVSWTTADSVAVGAMSFYNVLQTSVATAFIHTANSNYSGSTAIQPITSTWPGQGYIVATIGAPGVAITPCFNAAWNGTLFGAGGEIGEADYAVSPSAAPGTVTTGFNWVVASNTAGPMSGVEIVPAVTPFMVGQNILGRGGAKARSMRGPGNRMNATLLASPPPILTGITHVQNAFYNNGGSSAPVTSLPMTFGAAVGLGNTVCGWATWDYTSGITLSSVTDDKGNSYTVDTVIDPGNQILVSFVRGNITNSPTTVTVAISGAAGFASSAIDEYTGVAALTDPRDGSAHQRQAAVATTTDAISTGLFTTTINMDLLYGVSLNVSDATTPINTGTGFTLRNSITAPDIATSEDKIQTIAGSSSALTFSTTGSINVLTIGMALHPPSAAPPPPVGLGGLLAMMGVG